MRYRQYKHPVHRGIRFADALATEYYQWSDTNPEIKNINRKLIDLMNKLEQEPEILRSILRNIIDLNEKKLQVIKSVGNEYGSTGGYKAEVQSISQVTKKFVELIQHVSSIIRLRENIR